MFVHLNIKSNFSFGRGASGIDELLERAAELEIDALALTDWNGLYGTVPFAKKAAAMGIKPILGVTVDDPVHAEMRTVLLAKNLAGFGEICRLVTARRLDEDFTLDERIPALSPDVFVITPSVDLLKTAEHLKFRGQLFGETVYHTSADAPACRALTRFCKTRQIPLVATNDVHFARPESFYRHHILSAIFQNTSMKWARLDARPQSYLNSPRKMEKLYQNMPQLLRASREIAEQCNVDLELGNLKFPRFPFTDGEEPFEYLKKHCEAGLRRRYGENPGRDVVSRLHYELGVIDRLGFTEYFLVVRDIKEKAVEWGMPFIGRGSAANSIVSYCLGFTEVDPIEHNLYFERFLNPYRKSPPDIDLDFSWRERDRILNFVYERYGRDRVAMICTTVTFGQRAAVREIAKVMGLSGGEINRVTRRIPHWGAGKLAELPQTNPECAGLPVEIEPWKTVFREAEAIIGFPRHLSIHPGGIVIAPGKITDYVPLERARKGFVVTQYDMHPIEDIGLVKIDLLSQRSLGVLADTVTAVRRNYGKEPPVNDFAAVTGDRKTRELICSGRTMGCFYIESPGMRGLLKKLDCETFELLTAASSVIRPGVAESGMMSQFIERHHHPEKIEYLHPLMEKMLKETYGVMIYQEDVIKVAHGVAGLSLGDADLLRRAMSGKERSGKKMREMERRFLQGCAEKGVDEASAREIWRQVESFAGYAFCKAHSASFAVLSFKVAYLKAHCPAEFMAAVLANEGGFYGPAAYIEEARRMGVRVLLPDLNLSEKECSGVNGEIRLGFKTILNLKEETVDNILRARQEGFFTSLSDFLRRARAGVKTTALLIKSGAFDFLGETKPRLLWKLEALKDMDLNGGLFEPETALTDIPPLHDYDVRERFDTECAVFGFPVTSHPLEFLTPELSRGIVDAADIENHRGERVKMLGWAISHKRIKTRKSKELMKFLSLEDLTGTFEVTLFPKTYRKFAARTMTRGPYLVEGKVEDDSGTLSLVADRLDVV